MSTKRSAFSVFRSKPKSPATTDHQGYCSTDDEQQQIKLVQVKKHNSMSEIANASCPSTPTAVEEIPKHKNKSDQRMSAIRKSLRRKSKKEHHEIPLKQSGKENKLDKVGSYIQSFERSNWTESLHSLNSSCLEEEFLPNVVKQKKQQKKLHQLSTSSLPSGEVKQDSSVSAERRKRSFSAVSSGSDVAQKPPIPNKKSKAPPPTTTTKNNNTLSNSKTEKTPQKKQKESGPKIDQTPAQKPTSTVEEEKTAIASADKLFAWLIGPVKIDQFLCDVWQKKPLFIKRRQEKYNNIWFSTKEFDRILRQQNVQFTKNLDIAVFRNGKRETLNPDGRAFAPLVWKFYNEGCSVRLINPSTFSSNIWHLSAKLQEYFGCLIGSNVYLTPPGSQGFAPHYDDIEAFVIQLEGKKRWRLYPSRNVDEILPRYSSENMSVEELGEPILDRVLEPGDTLYFPRGVIHQAVTPKDTHSLHMTLSVFQKCCWSDFMEKLVPMALQSAIEEDIEFRKALPIGFQNHIGMSNSEKTSQERKSFMKTVEQLMKKMVSYVSVDQAVDELVLDQLEEFLPPSFTTAEAECSVVGTGAYWDDTKVRGSSEVTLDTRLRIVRPGIVRMIPLGDNLQIHNTLQNSRQYKEFPMSIIEIPLQFGDVAEYFLSSYPDFVTVKDAPTDDDDVKLDLAQQFYMCGLVRSETRLVED